MLFTTFRMEFWIKEAIRAFYCDGYLTSFTHSSVSLSPSELTKSFCSLGIFCALFFLSSVGSSTLLFFEFAFSQCERRIKTLDCIFICSFTLYLNWNWFDYVSHWAQSHAHTCAKWQFVVRSCFVCNFPFGLRFSDATKIADVCVCVC